uniref:Integrase catalytic domain-containing protein n=1 Tax=Onchocerca volvulus TaxID=6282 RepID=A0A8R1TN25_ONCVO
MSVEAFIQTFRRFASRSRRPDFVLSNNAKNFVLASKLIKENSNQNEKPLKWQFITPGAPWQGACLRKDC